MKFSIPVHLDGFIYSGLYDKPQKKMFENNKKYICLKISPIVFFSKFRKPEIAVR